MYRLFFRLLVFAGIDGESAHDFAAFALRVATMIPGVRRLLRRGLGPRDPRLRVRTLGLNFPSPLGLAAGVDSNASWFQDLGALGFGSIEVGTVTAEKQQGNPKPRVFRLVRDRAILNRRGFPNAGAAIVARHLRRRPAGPIVGVNVGKTKKVPLDRASEDYQESLRLLAPHADYVVLNVSSPNTPELRDMQSADRLRELVRDVRRELVRLNTPVPLLIKIAPDLSDEELDAISDLAVSERVDGIIAVNTTVSRSGLSSPSAIPHNVSDGGISGAPLKLRSLEVLRRIRSRVGDGVTLVSVGGIETDDDVWERICAGATLVQAHTAFVYGGPLWPRRINRALSRRLDALGIASIEDLVGTESTTEHRATNGDVVSGTAATPEAADPGRNGSSRPSVRPARVA